MNFQKPKQYADANLQQKADYYEYENIELETGNMKDYEILKKVGRGKYSEVFEGIRVNVLEKEDKEKVIIKVLKPVRQKKVKREIKILQNLSHPNIIRLMDVVRDPASKTTSLILEHIANMEHKSLYRQMKSGDLKFILKCVLSGLDYAHSKGIIHRDIKPHNIMVNLDTQQVKLIDWGLAEFYFPGKDYNVRVASRYFKAPELLLDYNYYDYSLDIWSLGCLFAGIIFQKEPFFMGSDTNHQMIKIIEVLGTPLFIAYLKKYQINLNDTLACHMNEMPDHEEVGLSSFVTHLNQHLASPLAIDLLEHMLVYDQADRITAQEALAHPYFTQLQE